MVDDLLFISTEEDIIEEGVSVKRRGLLPFWPWPVHRDPGVHNHEYHTLYHDGQRLVSTGHDAGKQVGLGPGHRNTCSIDPTPMVPRISQDRGVVVGQGKSQADKSGDCDISLESLG